ncbi:hypothetical protein DCO48_14030 [Pseudomonas sp. SDI]|uniref:hypothetical protein n=1 Tax=Pseudomonas sp. SDI TaxID=2170734 RepID=UPI000DE6F923|nr:hypothetical protein [Pseudomonas sp. SDI]PWB32226.1 hypothetical protein DCO48_14030 [Pseudomonas sp. SDI]
MSRWLVKGLLLVVAVLLVGCGEGVSNTFTLAAELPPNFTYRAYARYVPASGETCSVSRKDNLNPGFNWAWREAYSPEAKIQVRKVIKGCPMVVRVIKIEIFSIYGADRGDFSSDFAEITIREKLDDVYKNGFDKLGVSEFYGECQWLFRTSTSTRRLTKILKCTGTDKDGTPQRGGPFAAYELDQLAGATVRMNIKLAATERPYFKDTWVKFENGWKRCMGDGPLDERAYCNGNFKDFSKFRMPGGKECLVYPGCEE